MNVDKVEQLVRGGIVPKLVYTVPIANNPTGVGMTEERKKKLVELAKEFNFIIVADEVYMFLHFCSEKIPSSFFSYDDASNPDVLSLNSFSKILGPGLRLGWIATHNPHMARLLTYGAISSSGGLNPFTSATVDELFKSGIVQADVQRLRGIYKEMCEVMCLALEEYVGGVLQGEEWGFERREGVFFVFVRLPTRFDTDLLLERAKEKGVNFVRGRLFAVDKKGFGNCSRLCFTYSRKKEILEGVKRLAKAIEIY